MIVLFAEDEKITVHSVRYCSVFSYSSLVQFGLRLQTAENPRSGGHSTFAIGSKSCCALTIPYSILNSPDSLPTDRISTYLHSSSLSSFPHSVSLSSISLHVVCKRDTVMRCLLVLLNSSQESLGTSTSSFTASRRMSLESIPVEAWQNWENRESRRATEERLTKSCSFAVKERSVMVSRCLACFGNRACTEFLSERVVSTSIICQVLWAYLCGSCTSRLDKLEKSRIKMK